MSGGEKIKSFDGCLKFFNIPNFEFGMLSYSEQKLFRICMKFFIENNLDFEDLFNSDLIHGLDGNNRRKVMELAYQLLNTF